MTSYKIMEFVVIYWKNNIWKAYLPKTNIVGQIVSEILVLLCSDGSIQEPSQIYKDLYGVIRA